MMSALQPSLSQGRRLFMLGQYDHSDDAQVGERVVHRPALRIELQASERKLLASVRNSLLGWLSDPSVNSISREVGRPAKISLEEIDSQPGPGAVGTLRLNVVWAPENVACAEPAAEPMGQGALLLACPGETSEQNPPQQFVFFADPPILYSQLAHVPMEAMSDQAAIAHADRIRHALGSHRPPIARAMRKAEIRTLGLLSAWALALYAAARTVATRWLTAGWSRVVGGVLLLQKRLLKIDLRLAWRDAGSRAHAGGVAAAAGLRCSSLWLWRRGLWVLP